MDPDESDPHDSSINNTKCHLILKGCKNKCVKKLVKQTLKRRQDFGEGLMALGTLYAMFESNPSVRQGADQKSHCGYR